MLMAQYRPDLVIVTQGSRGGILLRGHILTHFPAFPVRVIDSCGAGDVFHGAFLAAYIRENGFDDCARFASAVSAIKCMHFGARDGVPSYDDVLAFMREREASK